MRKLILMALLAFLVACGDRGPVEPDEGPVFAKKCDNPPCDKGDGGGGKEGDYRVTDLGTLGGDFSEARDINDGGVIVGRSRDADGNHVATLWTTDHVAEAIGELDGYAATWAYAINNAADIVVGSATEDWYDSDPVFWVLQPDDTWLRTLLSGGTGDAYDVNADQVIVGYTHSSLVGYPRATLWHADAPGFPIYLGDERSFAYAINNAGHVVGHSRISVDGQYSTHAILWWKRNGAYEVCDLHGAPGGSGDALNSSADAVSDPVGEPNEIKVLGTRSFGGGEATVTVWTVTVGDCGSASFNDLPGSGLYDLHDINTSGEAVGYDLQGHSAPVLWTEAGELVELPALKGRGGSAQGINETGLIVGSTRASKAQTHAVLWTKRN
jgi:uncharacterized membrane protein